MITIERVKYTVHYPKNYLMAKIIGTISIRRVTVLVDKLKNLGSDRTLYARDGIILEAPVPAVQADSVDLRLLTVLF